MSILLALLGCPTEPPPTTEATPAIAEPPAPAANGGDVFPSSAGDVRVVPIVHGTLMLDLGGKIVHVDPWSKGDYASLPKADVVLITDVHFDHMDGPAVDGVKKDGTLVVAPPAVAETVKTDVVLKNGESKEVAGIAIEAVPMYNLVRGPEPGKLFHDKGRGNGYVLGFGGLRIYVAGDTECIDEMKALTAIDVAFVPMILPYTMPPDEAAACVKAFRPKVLFPYHYGPSNLGELDAALAGEQGIEVRKREWYPNGLPF